MTGKKFFISTSRMEAFSDGVFSIVITLSAFQFKIPDFKSGAGLAENAREILLVAPNILGFIFSFLFVAVFWVNHHQLYQTIKEANRVLLWLNLHLLFWITMLPFPVGMIGVKPMLPIVAISLGIVLLMCSFAALLLRRYAHFTARLADENFTTESIRGGLTKHILAIVLNTIAIFAATYSVYIAYAIYFVVLGLFMIPQKLETKFSLKQK